MLINVILIAVIVLFFVWKLMPVEGVHNISAAELKERIHQKGTQFIDVRTPGEYRGNHIRQFKNIPLFDLSKKMDALSKDKEVIVICQSGMRSMKASKILKKAGFQSVVNVKGGMNAWY
ncbi:rhodanese-like domain-containing protein [Fictibacillus fluitans]|uniref:Rhodanese-like domain-containing protein n=1 Tax=Fictibacillus fluitans TaxID=3058422 RepID=A0ABT8HRE9_9BACL|nr:rhodanese-like domain-containing protein [Fictibacillus sp. NE201]MDN4523341.1 rhodanese-like domain-containing protein [Fictibacillus sp. NE201]